MCNKHMYICHLLRSRWLRINKKGEAKKTPKQKKRGGNKKSSQTQDTYLNIACCALSTAPCFSTKKNVRGKKVTRVVESFIIAQALPTGSRNLLER